MKVKINGGWASHDVQTSKKENIFFLGGGKRFRFLDTFFYYLYLSRYNSKY
jgi:hypothetical protein